MASLTLPALALALSNPGAVRLRAAAFRCWALRRRGWAAAGALASPNSVLSEHAFKRLQLGSDDEDGEGPYGSDADEGFEAGEGDNEELAIARLGLPDELVATLEKRGITHLFPIQVNEPLRSLSLSLSIYLARLLVTARLSGQHPTVLAVGRRLGRGERVFNLGNWVTAFEIRGADLAYCQSILRRLFSGKHNDTIRGA
jgi:hypothetical protein